MNNKTDNNDETNLLEIKKDEEILESITKISDDMFDNGVWQNSKEVMKDMSKRDSSRHIFRLGFFMHAKYMDEQMKELAKEMENMPKEDVQKIIDSFKEKWEENRQKD